MPRLARKDIDTMYQHIMVQGIARESIFRSNSCKEHYLNKISTMFKENSIELLAYCLMPNHAHFLTCSRNIDALSYAMRKTNTGYALYYNKKNNRVGYVFRDRFRSEPVKDERHLLSCIVYIHNNPVAAGLCKKRSHYKWSSWHEYMGTPKIVTGVKKFLIGLSTDLTEARHKFEKLHNKEYEDIWMDNKEYSFESVEKSLRKYLISKGKMLEEVIADREMLFDLVTYLQDRTGVSLRTLANLLNLNREILRKTMSNPPSP